LPSTISASRRAQWSNGSSIRWVINPAPLGRWRAYQGQAIELPSLPTQAPSINSTDASPLHTLPWAPSWSPNLTQAEADRQKAEDEQRKQREREPLEVLFQNGLGPVAKKENGSGHQK